MNVYQWGQTHFENLFFMPKIQQFPVLCIIGLICDSVHGEVVA